MDETKSREAREAAKRDRAAAKRARAEARQARLQARTSAQQARTSQVEKRTETRTRAQEERRAAARAQRQAERRASEVATDGDAVPAQGPGEGELLHYAVIDRQEAPPQPPAPRGRMARVLTDLVDSLGPGLVARIEPQEGERPRKIVTNLYRVAGRIGKPVTTWEDQDFIYVELLDLGAGDVEAEAAAATEAATAEEVDGEIVDGAFVEDEVLEGELVEDDSDDGER